MTLGALASVVAMVGALQEPRATTGSLCIAAARPPAKIANQPMERGYTVQVDAYPQVSLSYEQSVQHPSLELTSRHAVRIRKDGRVVQSFYFRYDEASSESVCVFFEPYYAVWQLWPAARARHICKCVTTGSD